MPRKGRAWKGIGEWLARAVGPTWSGQVCYPSPLASRSRCSCEQAGQPIQAKCVTAGCQRSARRPVPARQRPRWPGSSHAAAFSVLPRCRERAAERGVQAPFSSADSYMGSRDSRAGGLPRSRRDLSGGRGSRRAAGISREGEAPAEPPGSLGRARLPPSRRDLSGGRGSRRAAGISREGEAPAEPPGSLGRARLPPSRRDLSGGRGSRRAAGISREGEAPAEPPAQQELRPPKEASPSQRGFALPKALRPPIVAQLGWAGFAHVTAVRGP